MGKSSPTRLQMKDVRYEEVLKAIAELAKKHTYFNARDVYACFPNIPYKIIARKLERLIDARFIEGCACGCSTGILVGMYTPLYEVVATYHDDVRGWTDTIRPIGWKKMQEQLAERQRREYYQDIWDQIREDFARYDIS